MSSTVTTAESNDRGTYLCPFCRRSAPAFLPFGFRFAVNHDKQIIGSGYRENAMCPVCRSLDRERLVFLYLLYKTDLFKKPYRLLHVAPENILGQVLRGVSRIDFHRIDLVPRGQDIQAMDLTALNFSEAEFDAVICNHVLEHINDDRQAMQEIWRVIKPGGWGILQVPMSHLLETTYEDFSITTPEARAQAFGQADHVRIYAPDYIERLRSCGFAVDVFDWTRQRGRFSDGDSNLYALNPAEQVFRVVKPE